MRASRPHRPRAQATSSTRSRSTLVRTTGSKERIDPKDAIATQNSVRMETGRMETAARATPQAPSTRPGRAGGDSSSPSIRRAGCRSERRRNPRPRRSRDSACERRFRASGERERCCSARVGIEPEGNERAPGYSESADGSGVARMRVPAAVLTPVSARISNPAICPSCPTARAPVRVTPGRARPRHRERVGNAGSGSSLCLPRARSARVSLRRRPADGRSICSPARSHWPNDRGAQGRWCSRSRWRCRLRARHSADSRRGRSARRRARTTVLELEPGALRGQRWSLKTPPAEHRRRSNANSCVRTVS
jgi:hypothetical protein